MRRNRREHRRAHANPHLGLEPVELLRGVADRRHRQLQQRLALPRADRREVEEVLRRRQLPRGGGRAGILAERLVDLGAQVGGFPGDPLAHERVERRELHLDEGRAVIFDCRQRSAIGIPHINQSGIGRNGSTALV